jgi:hypothetical protein
MNSFMEIHYRIEKNLFLTKTIFTIEKIISMTTETIVWQEKFLYDWKIHFIIIG